MLLVLNSQTFFSLDSLMRELHHFHNVHYYPFSKACLTRMGCSQQLVSCSEDELVKNVFGVIAPYAIAPCFPLL